MSDKFPIYCKDQGGVHAYMIITHDKAMIITNSPTSIGMEITHYHGTDHHIYDAWKRGDLIESNAKDFNIYRIQMNNHLISIGVSKEAQTTKPQQS